MPYYFDHTAFVVLPPVLRRQTFRTYQDPNTIRRFGSTLPNQPSPQNTGATKARRKTRSTVCRHSISSKKGKRSLHHLCHRILSSLSVPVGEDKEIPTTVIIIVIIWMTTTKKGRRICVLVVGMIVTYHSAVVLVVVLMV